MLNESRRGSKRRASAGTHPECVILSLLDQATRSSGKVIHDDKNIYVKKKCGIESLSRVWYSSSKV